MKYFIQFEGKEKLLIKCIFIAQVIITILLIKMVFRPIELYINNEQSKEIAVWLANELNSNDAENVEKVEE